MYYKVYIKINESEKKRLLFILAKVKNSAFDIYKGVKCVHLKKKCITVVFECFVFHSIYFLFFNFNILVVLGRLRLFLFFCFFFFSKGGKYFVCKIVVTKVQNLSYPMPTQLFLLT